MGTGTVVIMAMGMETMGMEMILCLRSGMVGMAKHRITVMRIVEIMEIISLDGLSST